MHVSSTGVSRTDTPDAAVPGRLGGSRVARAPGRRSGPLGGGSWRHGYVHGATYQGTRIQIEDHVPLQPAFRRTQRPPTGGPCWMGRRHINARCEKSPSDRSLRAAFPCPLKPASRFCHPCGSLDTPTEGQRHLHPLALDAPRGDGSPAWLTSVSSAVHVLSCTQPSSSRKL